MGEEGDEGIVVVGSVATAENHRISLVLKLDLYNLRSAFLGDLRLWFGFRLRFEHG